ncbi:hypothetical protein O7A70_33545, partial [Mesorhizobium sp. Cs1299R1N1]|uniref:hypothetical protein n=1 Tax=Mesorhizobium sp. Cs1299R1N1 TaxID=3015172 RepID=UPI00301D3B2F
VGRISHPTERNGKAEVVWLVGRISHPTERNGKAEVVWLVGRISHPTERNGKAEVVWLVGRIYIDVNFSHGPAEVRLMFMVLPLLLGLWEKFTSIYIQPFSGVSSVIWAYLAPVFEERLPNDSILKTSLNSKIVLSDSLERTITQNNNSR